MTDVHTAILEAHAWDGRANDQGIDITLGFGVGGSVEKVECRRCGIVMSRKA